MGGDDINIENPELEMILRKEPLKLRTYANQMKLNILKREIITDTKCVSN